MISVVFFALLTNMPWNDKSTAAAAVQELKYVFRETTKKCNIGCSCQLLIGFKKLYEKCLLFLVLNK